mgnify:FL=1
MSKYDWPNIPKKVKFIAIDADGSEYWFSKKPVWHTGDFYKVGQLPILSFKKSTVVDFFHHKHSVNDALGYAVGYMDSLEERPH